MILLLALLGCGGSKAPSEPSNELEGDTDTDADTDTDTDTDTDADTDTDTDADTDTDTDSLVCDEDASEPNDSFAEAIPSEGGAALWVQIGEPDFWSFAIEPGEEVRATVTHDPFAGDIDVYLLDASGEVTGRPAATLLPEEVAVGCNRSGATQNWGVYVEIWEASIETCNTYDWSLTKTVTGCPVPHTGDTGDTGDTGLGSPSGHTGDTGDTAGPTGTP